MKLAHHYYVYIVHCSDGFYTGISNNLEKRVIEHNEGKDIFSFTYKRRLVTLKYFEHFTDVRQAIARENS
jgi:putative endonuclease